MCEIVSEYMVTFSKIFTILISHSDVVVNPQKPYSFDSETLDTYFELKYGSESHVFPMDKASNGPFLEVRGMRQIHQP